MSEVKTEKVSARVTSLQLGKSGDTITIPSGATIDASAGTATGFGGDNTPAFQAYISSNQTLGDNVFAKIAANTEDFDTDNAYNNSTYEFVVPSGEGGKYFLYSRATFVSSGGSTAVLEDQMLQIRVNSETSTTARLMIQEKDIGGGYYKTFTLIGIATLAAADIVYFYARSDVQAGYNSYLSPDMRESFVGGYKMIGL
jgi:hypothetical protein